MFLISWFTISICCFTVRICKSKSVCNWNFNWFKFSTLEFCKFNKFPNRIFSFCFFSFIFHPFLIFYFFYFCILIKSIYRFSKVYISRFLEKY
ncbi:hypothetical protein MHP7448_0700 [Mesomycoplasma hyopneumoniae 7448]|uniref:Uncharacterized protein n=1 Tax=Mesomycoplasma hyopneumoniae (strain 7448) TaxID=262722 RepID=A4Q7W7_MESH7|nr:hypothetical protein MHP7448_0700 [Mesomycoplasma hyopneumoniae 7448]AGQ50731.1 hypothetical protein MHL_2857 [Mesomycoplasma hyopneumoniae 7422]